MSIRTYHEVKRSRSIVAFLLLVALIFLLAYVFYAVSYRNPEPDHEYAAEGKLDLTGFDFNTMPEPALLKGDWNYYPSRLLLPEQVLTETPPGTMFAPGRITKRGYDNYGYGTCHLQITVSEDAPEVLYMKLPIIQHASKVWVDGKLISEAGVPGETDETTEPKIAVTLAAIARDGETIDVVVWISNFRYFKSGFNNCIELGRRELIVDSNIQWWVMVALVLGGMLFIGFFNVAIYFFRAEEKINLYFGLMCILHFTRYAFGIIEMDSFIFPHVNENLKNMISSVSLYFLIYFLSHFTLSLMELERPRFVLGLRIATGIAVLLAFFAPYVPLVMDVSMLLSSLLPLLIIAYLTFWIARILKRLKNDIRLVFVVAYAAYVTCVLIEVRTVYSLRIPSFPAALALIAAQCIVLAQGYGKALEAVETANVTLEATVAERTFELQSSNTQLAASEQRLKDMVSGISHDLKTPLTVVSLNLEQLFDADESQTEAERRQHTALAYNKTLDLQRLTRNLFEAVRMESGRAAYNPEWVSLSKLFPEIWRRYGEYVESEGVTLAVRYGEDCEIWADTEKIWSIFDNTINNALRYTPRDGSITVTAEPEDGDTVTIAVTDTGTGIAAEHLPHIFRRFYKADPSRSGKTGDSGLGLFIVKSTAEGMGGSVSAVSRPGQGTSILIRLRQRRAETG